MNHLDNDAETGPGQPGPLDGIAWYYIEDLFHDNGNKALSAEHLATLLGFPLVAVRRVVSRAVNRGDLVEDEHGFRLAGDTR